MSTDAGIIEARSELAEALDTVGLVDHHVHGALRRTPSRTKFESMLSESDRPTPEWMSLFDSQIGLAIRRWCAPVLDLEPGCSPDDYVVRRTDLGEDEVNRRLLRSSGVVTYLVDTGIVSDDLTDLDQTAALSGARVEEIVRLETVFEDILDVAIAESHEPGVVLASYDEVIRDRARTAVGLKSVIAYRHGLDFDPVRPTHREVTAALGDVMAGAVSARSRVVHPTLLRHILWTGVDIGLPIQLHTGFGDPDLELHRCDPALLTAFLRSVEASSTDITLLHTYPYQRNAGFLAESFPGVYFDTGLGVNFTGLRSDAVIAESLELAPFAKMLYSSDAVGPAELHFLGARLWRRGMANAFAPWLAAGEVSRADVIRIAELIGSENSRRLYRLDPLTAESIP